MKRMSVMLLLLAGCGAAVIDPVTTRPTLAEARMACLRWDPNAPELFDVFASLFRARRNDGVSESDLLDETHRACFFDPQIVLDPEGCVICLTAVVAAVYR